MPKKNRTPRKMSRRQFLRASGLLSLAAAIQACQPSATPFPSATPNPTATTSLGQNSPLEPTAVAQQATPTLFPSSTPTTNPTASPTGTAEPVAPGGAQSPVATPTTPPTATLTPTPQPTPYPPGPPSKLGLFLTRYDPQALAVIEKGQPPLVKTMEIDPNFAKGIKDIAPNTTLVGRITLGQMNLDADPFALARQFVDQLLPLATESRRFDAFDGWEAYNEPVVDNPDRMKRLADFEAERTRLLAAEGIRSVVGNFAVGHPDLALWPDFSAALAAVQEHQGYLGLHEYSAPVMQFGYGALQPNNGADQGDEGWLTVRYRKAWRQYLNPLGFGDVPILMTECGVDGLVTNRPGPADAGGWKDFVQMWLDNGLRNHPAGVYMDQLIWYDSEMQKDAYVKGGAIFVAGGSQQWESYNILGEVADLLGQYLAVHPQG